MSDPYAELVALSERELELVTAGDLDELPELQHEREALVASLPEDPPASARGSLERAARLQAQTTAALAQAIRELGGELDRLDRGRSAIRGYAPAARPRHLVDQTG